MKNRLLALGVCLVLSLPACDKESLNKVNPNGGTPELFYTNTVELTQGVNAIYATLQGINLAGREYFFTLDLRSDEFATGGGGLEAPRAQLLTGAHTADNALVNSVWNGFYRTILRANAVIENAPKVDSKFITADMRARLDGEAKFLRAWSYYNLVSLWGGVPIYKVAGKDLSSETEGRATPEAVYKLIIEDLTTAQKSLLESYSGDDKGRATSGAASALLGKVYMNQGNYAAAKTELEKVKALADKGIYKLMPSYDDNFKEETGFNDESIFEVGFAPGQALNWGSPDGDGSSDATTRTQEYSAIGWRNVIPSNSLLADFESTKKGDDKNDPRFGYNFYRVGDLINGGKVRLDSINPNKLDTVIAVSGTDAMFEGKKEKISWKKYSSLYKNKETFYLGSMNMRVIRYADVLLLLAECENEVGTASAAIGYLNQVRSRPSVDMPSYPTKNYKVSNKDEIFAAVMHERKVELAGEQIRNFDILRWRKLGKLKTEPISYFKPKMYELLPIPQAEISNNSKFSQQDQNPGY
ncbi:MAG: RagB/SusD family nutrient uptake outer membrane protein [Bacteroidota bacterium]